MISLQALMNGRDGSSSGTSWFLYDPASTFSPPTTVLYISLHGRTSDTATTRKKDPADAISVTRPAGTSASGGIGSALAGDRGAFFAPDSHTTDRAVLVHGGFPLGDGARTGAAASSTSSFSAAAPRPSSSLDGARPGTGKGTGAAAMAAASSSGSRRPHSAFPAATSSGTGGGGSGSGRKSGGGGGLAAAPAEWALGTYARFQRFACIPSLLFRPSIPRMIN